VPSVGRHEIIQAAVLEGFTVGRTSLLYAPVVWERRLYTLRLLWKKKQNRTGSRLSFVFSSADRLNLLPPKQQQQKKKSVESNCRIRKKEKEK
jgi:hypothetical protein